MFAKTETVSLYLPHHVIKTDKNVVDGPYTLAASGVKCNLHRGSKEALAKLTALGLVAPQYATGFFEVSAEASLVVWGIVLDEAGEAWLVRERPIKRSRFPATAHLNCLLTLLKSKPNGVP